MLAKFLKNVAALLGFITLIAATPFIVSFAQLEPPWPSAVEVLSAAFLAISAVMAWEFTRKSRVGFRRGWMLTSLVAMVLTLFVYLGLNSYFIEYVPGSDLRVVRGYECTKAASEIYDTCPDLPREALEDAGWESVKLWTRSSVTAVRLLLVFSWFAFMAGLVGVLSAVIAGRDVGDMSFVKAVVSAIKGEDKKTADDEAAE